MDQRVLEQVTRVRRKPPLVEQFGVHQPSEALLELALIEPRHRPDQLIAERPPQGRAQLGDLLDAFQAVEPAVSEAWSVVGIDRGGSGRASA